MHGPCHAVHLHQVCSALQHVHVYVYQQFHLSYSDKELLERVDRGESQQEILRRIVKDLPVYTRTMSGGTNEGY